MDRTPLGNVLRTRSQEAFAGRAPAIHLPFVGFTRYCAKALRTKCNEWNIFSLLIQTFKTHTRER